MKYNEDYQFVKMCAKYWMESRFGEKAFHQLKERIRNRPAKIFKIFLKYLRKHDKALWHKFVD